jgi:hypothetical protein
VSGPFTSGSGLERTMMCDASTVLPRTFEDAPTAGRGKALHAYLELAGAATKEAAAIVAAGKPDPIDQMLVDALDQVDPEHREACRGVSLPSVAGELLLDHELSVAYHPESGTARILGTGLGRAYDGAGVRDDEIPATLDVAGEADDGATAVYRDYKSGWGSITPTRHNWQMLGGSLALARAIGADRADAQLVYLRDRRPVRRDPAILEPVDLLEIEHTLRARWRKLLPIRREVAAGGPLPPTHEGSWCRYCPSFRHCPAKVALLRTAEIDLDGPRRMSPMSDDEARAAYLLADRIRRALQALDKQLAAFALQRGLLLERHADGSETWYAETIVEGNDKLDPSEAIAASVSTLLPPPPAETDAAAALAWSQQRQELVDQIATITVSKKAIGEAISDRVARGGGAAAMRKIMGLIAAAGGITNKARRDLAVFTVPPAPRQIGKP